MFTRLLIEGGCSPLLTDMDGNNCFHLLTKHSRVQVANHKIITSFLVELFPLNHLAWNTPNEENRTAKDYVDQRLRDEQMFECTTMYKQ